MFPVVLVVVVLGVSVAAVAVDLLYDGDKPATAGGESRSSAEPWPTIWRGVRGAVGSATRSISRDVTRVSVAVTGGLARAVRAVAGAAAGVVRSARAADDLLISDLLARSANLRERRALHRVTIEVREERARRRATAVAAHRPALSAAGAAGATSGTAAHAHAAIPGQHAGGGEIPALAGFAPANAAATRTEGATTTMSSPAEPWWRTAVLPGPPPPRGARPPGPLLPQRWATGQPGANGAGAPDRNARAWRPTLPVPLRGQGRRTGWSAGRRAPGARDARTSGQASGRVTNRRQRTGEAAFGTARRPADPRRRAGVPVPLGTSPTARFRALAALLAITTLLGVVLAGALLALAFVVLRALGGL